MATVELIAVGGDGEYCKAVEKAPLGGAPGTSRQTMQTEGYGLRESGLRPGGIGYSWDRAAISADYSTANVSLNYEQRTEISGNLKIITQKETER